MHPTWTVGQTFERTARLQFFTQHHEPQLLQFGRGDVRHDVAIKRNERTAQRHVRIGHLDGERPHLLRNTEHFAIERGLVAEVVVNAGHVDVGEAADFARRRAFIALRCEDLKRSPDQPTLGVGLLEIGSRSLQLGNLVTVGTRKIKQTLESSKRLILVL